MIPLSIFLVFVFGTLIGSFLNVVIFRHHTNKPIANDRSVCLSCSKKLSWFELLPIISFLIQKGRCRGCHSTFSWQYPLIEFFTGLVFVAVFLKDLSVGDTFYFLCVFSLLIVILGYDFRHKIIPDDLVYTFILVSLGYLLISQNFQTIDLLAGPALAIPFAFLWFISQGRWIGFGDAKLVLGIGWFLGMSYGLSAIVIAFWIGALVGVTLIFLSKITKILPIGRKINLKSEIPFAPFLILGIFIAFVWEVSFWDLSTWFVLV